MITRLLKQLFCKHDYDYKDPDWFERGDVTCIKCGKIRHGDYKTLRKVEEKYFPERLETWKKAKHIPPTIKTFEELEKLL